MNLTVAICTNGRDSLVHAVNSIAKQSRVADKLLIVDQSGQGKGKAAVREYPYPSQVVEQSEKGLSIARNAVLENLETDWVFFTDDDCLASLDLVDQFHKVVSQFPESAFLAGTCIRPMDYDPKTQDVPGVYVWEQSVLDADTAMKNEAFMGACLAFRKDLLEKTGEFDPFLGAGTEWPAGEECDYVFRAIAKGFTGLASARLIVFHEYGARQRPADDIDNGRIGNAVVLWKARKIGDPKLVAMAERIGPYGRKRVLISRLTLGAKYSVDLRMKKRVDELLLRLDREYEVEGEVIVKKRL